MNKVHFDDEGKLVVTHPHRATRRRLAILAGGLAEAALTGFGLLVQAAFIIFIASAIFGQL